MYSSAIKRILTEAIKRFLTRYSGVSRLSAGLVSIVFVACIINTSEAQPPDNCSIRNLIISIEESSGYRFLYRDALIAGKNCEVLKVDAPVYAPDAGYGTLESPDSAGSKSSTGYPRIADSGSVADYIRHLEQQLYRHNIAMRLDSLRKQIILYEMREEQKSGRNLMIRGQVIDASSGSRLPYASISWTEGDRLRGISTNEAGYFQADITQAATAELSLTASYIGYERSVITFDTRHLPGEISIRLTPAGFSSTDVIITGVHSRAANDTLWRSAGQWAGMPAVGDKSTIRYLIPLPSVSITGALSDGLIVRGSKSDGFQVLLDGIQIFNQNHFFGMFDAFNSDALQTAGYYYDITPAILAGAPGGTLAVLTRTGSQQRFRAQASLSSSTVKGSVEGPLASGRGSWLFAGRGSVMDQMGWFNGTDLVAWGLDVGREREPLPPQFQNPGSRVLFPGKSSAMFFDLHSKVFYEWEGGRRLTVNAYLGGDDTNAGAERLMRDPEAVLARDRFVLSDVESKNNWGNEAVTFHFQSPAGERIYLHNMAGFSRYHASFSKDDFTYQRSLHAIQAQRAFIQPFANENSLLELKLTQYLDYITPASGSFTGGYELIYRRLEYEEESAFNAAYTNETESVLFDLFVQHDWKESPWIHTWTGVRSHYYSNGGYFYLSPRLQFRIMPERMFSFGAGYSRNYQFLHKLTLQNIQTAAFWILTDKYKEPTITDHISGGIYMHAGAGIWLQAELFRKEQQNLRHHEINNRMLMTGITNLNYPWFMNNDAAATGIELMYRQLAGPFSFTHSYTLSEVKYRNDVINNGAAFHPEWDRRHQYTLTATTDLGRGLALRGLWTYASGAANIHALTGADDQERLDNYRRLDLGVQYERRFNAFDLEINLAAYNVLNRTNVLYREPVMVIDRETRLQPAADFVYLDVYDLGFQPSFEIRFRF